MTRFWDILHQLPLRIKIFTWGILQRGYNGSIQWIWSRELNDSSIISMLLKESVLQCTNVMCSNPVQGIAKILNIIS